MLSIYILISVLAHLRITKYCHLGWHTADLRSLYIKLFDLEFVSFCLKYYSYYLLLDFMKSESVSSIQLMCVCVCVCLCVSVSVVA